MLLIDVFWFKEKFHLIIISKFLIIGIAFLFQNRLLRVFKNNYYPLKSLSLILKKRKYSTEIKGLVLQRELFNRIKIFSLIIKVFKRIKKFSFKKRSIQQNYKD